jgi:signal transduction histidine kinase
MASMRREGVPLGTSGEELEAEVRRMDRMLEDFLQAARPAVARLERVEAMGLLTEVGSLARRVWQVRGVTIEVVEGAGLVWMRADPALVRRILLNLVRNAAESMGAGGRVVLRVRGGMESRGGRTISVVMLEVGDAGVGISRGAERGLFEPFASRKEGGTGLGLWMATRLAAAQGGHLEYRTEAGRGTLFTLAMPRCSEGEAEGEEVRRL